MNPILPRNHFVPDGEAHVMPDGRLYLYGSYDVSGCMEYCSDVLHVFSTDDMIHWTDHGVAFRSSDVPWAKEGSMLYAPDCIHKGGKYYLYFCMNNAIEGVAAADHPWGPFTDPTPILHADGDSIDPAIFIDDDGQAYYYWGQFSLRGAKMNADMRTLDEATIDRRIIDEKRHSFHEGASMRKRNGLYYLVFTDVTRGRATSMGYAVSKSPLGPFEYKGIIIDNIGCDPKTWNDHGSIEEFNGQWYVFYHRSTQNGVTCRRMCVEPIFFDENGDIREVLPTTQGVEPPISVRREISAADVCRMGGWGTSSFIMPDPLFFGEELLTHLTGNGWAAYRYVNFDQSVSSAVLTMESDGNGTVEIWADSELLGEVKVSPTDGKRAVMRGGIRPAEGIHTLYLEWKMEKGAQAQMKSIRFE